MENKQNPKLKAPTTIDGRIDVSKLCVKTPLALKKTKKEIDEIKAEEAKEKAKQASKMQKDQSTNPQ